MNRKERKEEKRREAAAREAEATKATKAAPQAEAPKAAAEAPREGCTRPTDKKREEKQTKKTWDIAKLPADRSVSLVVYPGCVENDRVTVTVNGDARNVFLYGTAAQVASYIVGDRVQIGKIEYAARNVGKSQVEAVARVKDEMKGTGKAAEDIKKKKGQFGGYAITANGKRVTDDSVLNPYFKEMVFVNTGKDKPEALAYETYLKDQATYAGKAIAAPGKTEPIVFLGGVEMIVSAVIVPGSETYRRSDDLSNLLK
jgi:hypothetical protein